MGIKEAKVITDDLSQRVIGCLIEVHRTLGPGLLESVYEHCLAHEFKLAGIPYEQQLPLPVCYKGDRLDCGYRLDLVVDKTIVIELKAVDTLLPVHEAQLMTYLKLCGLRHGFLVNFNTPRLIDGLKSILL